MKQEIASWGEGQQAFQCSLIISVTQVPADTVLYMSDLSLRSVLETEYLTFDGQIKTAQPVPWQRIWSTLQGNCAGLERLHHFRYHLDKKSIVTPSQETMSQQHKNHVSCWHGDIPSILEAVNLHPMQATSGLAYKNMLMSDHNHLAKIEL